MDEQQAHDILRERLKNLHIPYEVRNGRVFTPHIVTSKDVDIGGLFYLASRRDDQLEETVCLLTGREQKPS